MCSQEANHISMHFFNFCFSLDNNQSYLTLPYLTLSFIYLFKCHGHDNIVCKPVMYFFHGYADVVSAPVKSVCHRFADIVSLSQSLLWVC